jgi:chromatin remodeling complex protein RSC6
MTLTLAEVLQKLEKLKYELSVWTLLENKLCPYLDMDKHRRAEAGLRVTGCSEDRVPVEVFERIIETIRSENINPIADQIEEIEQLNVQESEEEEGEEANVPKKVQRKRRSKTGKTATKKSSSKRKESGSKRIRSIAGRARQKSARSG